MTEGVYVNWESLVGNHSFGTKGKWDNMLSHTFVVVLPNNERREVKAAYMEVDGGSLYFEDDDQETILAFGPGCWVWAERVIKEL